MSSQPGAHKLGAVTATLFTAAMIVGTGLFTSLGAATAEAGSGVLIAVALMTGISGLMPIASACTLVWYFATHRAALEVPKDQRIAPIFISWLGGAACVGLVLSLPPWSLALSAGLLLGLASLRWAARRGPADRHAPST